MACESYKRVSFHANKESPAPLTKIVCGGVYCPPLGEN
jgi:hypothetical protein